MNYADFVSQPNGFPLESDATLGFMQDDYQSAIRGLAGLAGGNKVIVSGMKDTGASVSNGWLIFNGELMRFEGGAKQSNIVIETTAVQKQNDGGSLVDRYFTKKVKFGNGTGAVPYSELIRIETVQGLTDKLISLFSFESEIVVKGCEVSNVTISNCDISAGIVLIDGKFFTMAPYSGGYPIYINKAGEYVNTQPPDHFIKFDPHTSQRYTSVFKRASTFVGEVIQIVTLSDRWDGSGKGKWDYKGFALCNGDNGTVDLRGRFIIAHDARLADPGNGIWDSSYKTPGYTGGNKSVTLTNDNLPPHTHKISQGNSYTGNGPGGTVGRGSVNPNTFETEANVTAHTPVENRPPFMVLVIAQRI